MLSILLRGTHHIPEVEGSPVSPVCLYSHSGGQEWTSKRFCRREKVVIQPKVRGVTLKSSFSLSLMIQWNYNQLDLLQSRLCQSRRKSVATKQPGPQMGCSSTGDTDLPHGSCCPANEACREVSRGSAAIRPPTGRNCFFVWRGGGLGELFRSVWPPFILLQLARKKTLDIACWTRMLSASLRRLLLWECPKGSAKQGTLCMDRTKTQ